MRLATFAIAPSLPVFAAAGLPACLRHCGRICRGGFPYPLTRPGLIPNLFGFGAAYLRYIFIFPVSMATCQYSTGCTKVQIPAETCLEAINGS